MEYWPRGLRHLPAKKEIWDNRVRWFESNILRQIIMKGKQMAKTNASFKLSKSVKRVLATMTNKHQRGEVKKLFIDAEWQYTHQPKSFKKEKFVTGTPAADK